MSPHVGNFVADLVEMAKATETLPVVQAELAETKSKLEVAINTVMGREERIMELKSEIESLQAKLRDAEVARDDAELRFLEVEDKLGRVLNLVRGMGETLGQAVVDVTPRPEPSPEAQPLGQSEPGPISTAIAGFHGEPEITGTAPIVEQSSASTPAPEVAPPANPTAPSEAGNGPSSETATATPNADAGADASSDPYRNEPEPQYSSAWYDWANDMDHKYGRSTWPDRVA